MARKPINRDLGTEPLRPAARPVDTFITPPPSPLRDLADALATIDKPLKQFLDGRAEKQAEEDRIRGEAAFYDDNADDIAELVRTDRLPAHYSPGFVKGFKSSQGNVAGRQLRAKFNAAFDSWEGKNSDDPEAYDAFVEQFLAANFDADADPDVLRAALPHVRELTEQGYGRYTEYRHRQTVQGSLDAHVAEANQDIDELNREGLSTEEGTNYPVVFEKIAEKRAAFLASGGNPESFDKSMMDAMSAKVLATRDPGLLAWFDQQVPGESFTYGDTPYGSKVKLETEQSLEVIARRAVTEDAAKQEAVDKKRKDDATRAAIEHLSADPAAVLPDDILKAGEVDPTFKVRVEEWRKALGGGFTDPQALKEVYNRIIAGEGFKAVTDAVANGVFGRPEDLREAYGFMKSVEDNRGRMSTATQSYSFNSLSRTIVVKTQRKSSWTEEAIAGTSYEGYEALYDLRRQVTDWVIAHPDASLMETEEAVARIGKSILDRLVEVTDPGPEDEEIPAATYERPEGLGFDNPYANAKEPARAPIPRPPTPTLDDGRRAELKATLDRLSAPQRKALEDRAKLLKVPVEQLLDVIVRRRSGQPAEDTGTDE